jgi:hypothetical protein
MEMSEVSAPIPKTERRGGLRLEGKRAIVQAQLLQGALQGTVIIGVDRLLDMARTMINVWGDCVGAKIITPMAPDAE